MIAVVAKHNLRAVPVESDAILFIHVRLIHLGFAGPPDVMGLQPCVSRVLAEPVDALNDRSCQLLILPVDESLELRRNFYLWHLLRVAEQIANGVAWIGESLRAPASQVIERPLFRLLPPA